MDERNLTGSDVEVTSSTRGERTDTVELPRSLVERVEARLDHSEFDTPDEYVTYVVEEVVGRVEAAPDAERTSSVDRAEIENRLRSLGYLN